MIKIVALLGVVAFSLAVSYLSMIWTWGLEVKSWCGFFLVSYLGNFIAISVAKAVLEEAKNK